MVASCPSIVSRSRLPVVMIAQKIVVVPGVERRPEEHADDLGVAHLPEAAVGSKCFSAYDAEFSARYFLAQKIVLSVEGLFVEAAQLFKALAVKQHEHAGAERLQQ